METVTSADGTTIAYDRLGEGPPVVLISGGSVDRQSNAPLAGLLAPDFTVLNYDRRGRGPSGDAEEYAVQREIEDVAAVIEANGGTASVYGASSGAALGLLAAAAGVPMTKLVLWEPPYIVAGTRPLPPADSASTYRRLVAEGRRGDAAEFFMVEVVGMPAEFAAQARQAPWWAWQEGLAHTLAYDAEVMGDYTIPTEAAAAVTVPTLVLVGGGSWGWLRTSTKTLVEAIPDVEYGTLPEQTHDVAPAVLAPALKRFLLS